MHQQLVCCAGLTNAAQHARSLLVRLQGGGLYRENAAVITTWCGQEDDAVWAITELFAVFCLPAGQLRHGRILQRLHVPNGNSCLQWWKMSGESLAIASTCLVHHVWMGS